MANAPGSLSVVLGAYNANNAGGKIIRAHSWCHHKLFWQDREGPHYDLAMVRLYRDVKYRPRIRPACMELSKEHSRETSLATVGFGRTDMHSGISHLLKTIQVSRNCYDGSITPYRQCYSASTIGGTCPGDSGGPLIAYDKCDTEDQRAYVVGAVSGGPKDGCHQGQFNTQFFVDFRSMAQEIRDLVTLMLDDNLEAQDNFKCYRHQ